MRRLSIALAVLCFALLLIGASLAPDKLSPGSITSEAAYAKPWEMLPLGADDRGRPLVEYATQGAKIVALPALLSGVVVAFFGMVGGLLRCTDYPAVDACIQLFGEVVGSLPRMVVLLVTALVLPFEWKGLLPLAIIWAVLAAPSAMDEAGAVSQRLGGSSFVEALRAHGFSAPRIYLYHIVGLNLRPVLVRQGAEIMMQVVFLEVALSYLAVAQREPSFTHPHDLHSWADLLRMGYVGLLIDVPSTHALVLGLGLIALTVVTASSLTKAAGAR
jgi:peptide/nickel transport system permease protein